MSIEQLNSDYGITGQLKFVEGKGGFPFIEIENTMARALISVYGGHVLSFQPINEPEDLIFTSEKAYYQEGKAIRGGIPLCWPWFGDDPEDLGRSSHGFARNRFWTVLGTELTSEKATKVKLGLVDTTETRKIWSQAFNLTMEISVGDTLTLELITSNTGEQAFSITQAFHTYFKIGDINQVKVLGLEDTTYLDKVENYQEKSQRGVVTIAGEVDRIYTNVPKELVIDDASFGRRIRITSDGNKTAVVWNPWAKISAKMADLADEDYTKFICVETVNAAKDTVEILPSSEYRLLANYKIERS
ncbi:MAG: D-hexose-6-phosphate mutarotase [Xenococcaceae cyanobacterium MO_188.B29]|nr:D-hexose-6-phosphate mutarotase [Xenococcaceae cyanobacterium MO_188.B29]